MKTWGLAVAGALVFVGAGCTPLTLDKPSGDPAKSLMGEAVALVKPTEGNKCEGTVTFTIDGDKMKVVANLEGLPPGQHAIHIHEMGDCTAHDGMSAGGHYNPEHYEHGLPTQAKRHAGDLGNLTADNNGKAHYEIVVDNISLVGTKNPILGRAIIVHAQADDGSQPSGNAGARLGCALIHLPSAK